MSLKVAIQMDAIENFNIKKDSTFVIGLEALKRGYDLYYYLVPDLRFEDGKVLAKARKVTELRREVGNHFSANDTEAIDLKEDIDIVLMRQDPPFDMNYITATHILDHLKGHTLVLNDPSSVRNAPEKLLVTHFPQYIPETLITSDSEAIRDFWQKHKKIILKPLYGNGGEQIYLIDENNLNINALLEMFDKFYNEPIIAQRYIPEATEGDKRIILIDGEVAGAVLRVPAKGEARANFDAGGTGVKSTLTEREIEICEALKPLLKEQNLVFTGIDIIGDYITEINVTSPTGLQQINQLDGVCLESDLWDAFERKLK